MALNQDFPKLTLVFKRIAPRSPDKGDNEPFSQEKEIPMFDTRARQHLPAVVGAAILLSLATGCGRPAGLAIPAKGATVAQQAMLDAASAERREENEPGWTGPKEDLGHFFKVNDTLFRGQQPTDKGFEQLKGLGVKHIVYLHFNKKQAAHEKAVVEGLGMRFTHIPMSWITPPKQAQIDQWLQITTDPAQGPVFVHCQHGKDRTGAMVGIYRIKHDKWTYDKAYAEMKEKGFRTFLFGLSFGVKRFAKANGATNEAFTEQELAYAN
jgi:protein tyrosine phosphatase (PTP) superfamily phosphohydrolase (DUF442 family)